MDFTLSTYFNSFDVDKEYTIEASDLAAQLERVTESLANNPESINFNAELFEDLIDLIHGFPSLSPKQQKQLGYLITSSCDTVAKLSLAIVSSDEFADQAETVKGVLEKYGYLMFVYAKFLAKEDRGLNGGTRSKNAANAEALARWKSNSALVEEWQVAVSTVLMIPLSKIFVTTPERDLFVELFTRPLMNLMELPERMRVAGIKLLMYKNICVAVKQHGHASIMQHSMIQSLTYYAHLPIHMADLLKMMVVNYDYTTLTEEVLRELAHTEFSATDNNGPRAISEFLIRLSEHCPRLMLKQLIPISQLLDNSNQTLRCSVVETCGNIVLDILKSMDSSTEDETDATAMQKHAESLLGLLQERCLDSNPYVRRKAFQAMTKVCGSNAKLKDARRQMVKQAVLSLNDRSAYVRRAAINLLSQLIVSHDFSSAHGTQLALTFWTEQLLLAEEKLKQLTSSIPRLHNQDELHASRNEDDMDIDQDEAEPDEGGALSSNADFGRKDDASAGDSASSNDLSGNENAVRSSSNAASQDETTPDLSEFMRAKLKVDYYKDALEFIHTVHEGTELIINLLFSKNRNEAIDSMDYLVLADAYSIENALAGIRRMIHLVWQKGTSEEGKSVPLHLIDCYRKVFLRAPPHFNTVELSVYVAKNLIKLTHEASLADLASLEKLLCLMYSGNLIGRNILKVLWEIYSLKVDSMATSSLEQEAVKQKCGAIIILGMLALEDPQIVVDGIDLLLRVGFDERDPSDLALCKYTCLALLRVISKATENEPDIASRVPRQADIVERLTTLLSTYEDNQEWFNVAEQAISALFGISLHPDEDCSSIIKNCALRVFSGSLSESEQVTALSQLLFTVGHCAIKMIVYLERLENRFKKNKQAAETKIDDKEKDTTTDGNELEMIGGTSEDDFADAIINVKERELLFGPNALLARFGPLVKEVCANNKKFDNETLQRSAVLCMSKLMCVLSIYCEENLPIFVTIMEKSPDPITRSNCVLGLGDMAVCFNNVVEESTDFLYRRLDDPSLMVQRTCLMTVTFLILAGQVKVKGQLSAMAKCLENPDPGISDMCKLFFAELATKDNAIYNGFIDIFSGLSHDPELTEDAFKRIVRFLISFIDKERHQRHLAEKLLVRLQKSRLEKEFKDVAFALTTIAFKNEAITEALEEGFKLVQARE